MADIVIGVASSHTPQLSSGVDMWLDHAERDRRNPRLLGKDAAYHTYNELLAVADPAIGEQLVVRVVRGVPAEQLRIAPVALGVVQPHVDPRTQLRRMRRSNADHNICHS